MRYRLCNRAVMACGVAKSYLSHYMRVADVSSLLRSSSWTGRSTIESSLTRCWVQVVYKPSRDCDSWPQEHCSAAEADVPVLVCTSSLPR